jgi:hypothetical protein
VRQGPAVPDGSFGHTFHIERYIFENDMKVIGDEMSIMDLKCQESVSSFRNYCNYYKDKNYLYLGGDYNTYLSFPLPPYSFIKHLKQAKPILYKIYAQYITAQTKYDSAQYDVYPLLDFFNYYICRFAPPAVDDNRVETFTDHGCCGYSEVDITRIVKSWIHEEIENKGLVLKGHNNAKFITYASDCYDIQGMRPILRLVYEENSICPVLSTAACTVEVK